MSDEYKPTMRSTFLYFAYGSNLWTKRIQLQNPSAIRKGIAELKGYRLGFKAINYSDPTIPNEHKPSKTYKNVFVKGAEESQLPEKYIAFLKSVVDNDREAHPDLLAKLYGENQK